METQKKQKQKLRKSRLLRCTKGEENRIYRTRAIIGRSRFEAALVYNNEEFPFLVHKLSAI